MEIKPRIIRNYVTPEGREPFEDWLDSLKDKKTQALVLERLNRIRLGNPGDCKHLDKGLYELRVHYGPGYRIYFGDLDGVIVILLCGGTKSSQNRDIKRAREYWQELKERTDE
ncbi:type II toxin-antitoxin system RelE/ParE family toxin [Candidatus Poribacteria bacterium]|nr:type II toxin-antitoxin system RelE/ParE family toxin [Candidatus Poribacteria bacterium]